MVMDSEAWWPAAVGDVFEPEQGRDELAQVSMIRYEALLQPITHVGKTDKDSLRPATLFFGRFSTLYASREFDSAFHETTRIRSVLFHDANGIGSK